MDGIDIGAVADAPEVELEVQDAPEEVEGAESPETPESEQQTGNKLSREYSQWIKNGMDPSHPNAQRFGRMAKDDHARGYALAQIDPRGIDGIRELKAQIDAVEHGELRGVQAIQAIQDTLNEVSALDERIVQGDFGVIESFGPEMQAGILKMVPNFLEMQQKSDPEGYAKTLLPHFVSALRESPMVQSFNSLVDALQEAPPQGMPAEAQKWFEQQRWQKASTHINSIAEWLNTQDKQAKALQNGNTPQGAKPQAPSVQDERTKLDQERQKLHYETNVTPQTNKYADTQFKDLLKPYDSRLKLNDTAKGRLAQDFVSAVIKKANANPVYRSQMDRFYKSRNPDPKQVVNLFKVEFDKHAKSVMKDLVTERYGNFLNARGSQQPAARPAPANGAKGPVAAREYVVSSRPSSNDIDHQHPKYMELYAQRKYPMKDGRIAVWRQQ